jgi:hypothetical protein
MLANFNESEFLSRVYYGAIRLPGGPEAIRIENAAGCDGVQCHTAWIHPERDEIVSPESHSHMICTDANGLFDIEAVFKNFSN